MELVAVFLFLFCIMTYFFPSIISYIRGKKNSLSIFLGNIFFGWTLVGWLILLIIACSTSAVDKLENRG